MENRINVALGRDTHTRIYSTNDSKIVLDELALPVYHKNDNYANKGIVGEREKDNTARIEKGSGTVNSSTGEKKEEPKKDDSKKEDKQPA
jgi:hypothetical protein